MVAVPERLVHGDVGELAAVLLDALGDEPHAPGRAVALAAAAAFHVAGRPYAREHPPFDRQGEVSTLQGGEYGFRGLGGFAQDEAAGGLDDPGPPRAP